MEPVEKITERENFFRLMRHEQPDFMPHQPSLLQMIIPSAIGDRAENCGTGYDWFGVHWTEDPSMPMMPMVTPGMDPVLEDIEDWEDVIEWPDLDAIDWEACAKKDVPVKDPSKILCAMMVSGPFERLHDLMGFEEALCALVTNPEECEAFFSRLCDFKIEQIKRLKKYYDVDMVHFQDDWGTQNDLMFQPEVWRTLIRPHVKRVVDAAHELGVLFDQHSCGKIDRIVGDVVDMGIDVLDPVQPVNDLPRWIEEYKDKVIFMGALDAQNVIDDPEATDEAIMAEVKEKIDLFGNAGARFIPFAVSLTPNVMKALDDCYVYGRTFYSDKYADDVETFKAEAAARAGQPMKMGTVPGTDMNQ